MKKQLTSLLKAVGKNILPDKVIDDYRFESVDLESRVNNPVLIFTLDSCRYDVFVEAYDEQLPAKNVQKTYSPACWTIPAHEAIIRGSLPYNEIVKGREYLINDYDFADHPLTNYHSYSFGSTALFYLSKESKMDNNFFRYFDDYNCVRSCTDDYKVLEYAKERIEDKRDQDFFGLINLGLTHYPYNHYEMGMDEFREKVKKGEIKTEEAKEKQVEACKKSLEMISEFRDEIPAGTQIIITGDHGELLGEEGSVGHNPNLDIKFHEKLHEVPFLQWVES